MYKSPYIDCKIVNYPMENASERFLIRVNKWIKIVQSIFNEVITILQWSTFDVHVTLSWVLRFFLVVSRRQLLGSSRNEEHCVTRLKTAAKETEYTATPTNFFCRLQNNVLDAASLFQTNHVVQWNAPREDIFPLWRHGFFVLRITCLSSTCWRRQKIRGCRGLLGRVILFLVG